ncbi:MAG TPA: NifU family protein [Candidatus Omnitrophota bacterium]|jgi:Fe-S cluster biogenesis protein NfuA|nr:NifU family protein [Candidatus Omnitrophota bacterium]HSA31525.1 NifU family protein [Candidatus Omnitrophota bacterium]
MPARIFIQNTPNPHSVKFILDTLVKSEGKAVYKSSSDCKDIPLASKILDLDHVVEVCLSGNFVTVSQDGKDDWDALEQQIKAILESEIEFHNPNFKTQETTVNHSDNPDIAKIEAIIDQTIRPALNMHGGDLEIVDYHNKILRINYQGACGSCPSATFGTLQLIENILKEQFDPDVAVIPA